MCDRAAVGLLAAPGVLQMCDRYAVGGSFGFDWEAKCVRKGYEDYRVVRDGSETEGHERQRWGDGVRPGAREVVRREWMVAAIGCSPVKSDPSRKIERKHETFRIFSDDRLSFERSEGFL